MVMKPQKIKVALMNKTSKIYFCVVRSSRTLYTCIKFLSSVHCERCVGKHFSKVYLVCDQVDINGIDDKDRCTAIANVHLDVFEVADLEIVRLTRTRNEHRLTS